MSEETQAEVSQVRPGQRIAKVMARAGVCSRRDAEAWIAEGRVSVNGQVLASPAFNVGDTDDVRVDGKRLGAAERTRLFLFHKARGFVTTARDPEGRPTVFDALPPGLPRLIAIGRLDINTEGLLLLTNDGGLARVLELPSTGWLRRYRVRAHGTIDQAALDRLSGGITVDGVAYQAIEASLDREQGSNVWITLGLREGKNREIKKVLEHLGLQVNRLIRVSFGPFELGDLAEGEAVEVRTRVLRDQLGAKLAREAEADFDAPLIARNPPAPAEPGADERRARRATAREPRYGGDKPGRDGGRARSEDRRRDAPQRRAPAGPSTPERRRKHVSRLRAEIAADAAATRKRLERSATYDRKGRTIAVERLSPTREEARRRAAAEARPRGKGAAGRGAGPGERAFERSGSGKRGGDGEGRSRRFEPKAGEPRAAARGGAEAARRFDRPADQRRGSREFDRPGGKGRVTRGGDGAPRARAPEGRRPRPPGKGPPKGPPKSRGGPRRPPRKP